MAVNARTEEFQHIEVFDKPALFTNGRIARDTVPKGWYCYDIRGSDDDPGELCYMEENVVVNHAGSVLMPEKLAIKERPDVLEVLKKSDRKMKYMEVDLKSEQRRKNAENGAESYVPSKEDSLERLVYSAKCQFADDAEGVEDAVIKKDDLCRLRAALDQLSEEERALIHALFFDECSERELEEMMGIHRMTIHNRKIRILQKLKKMLKKEKNRKKQRFIM